MSILLSGRGKGVETCWNQSPFAVADVSGWQHRSQKSFFRDTTGLGRAILSPTPAPNRAVIVLQETWNLKISSTDCIGCPSGSLFVFHVK